MEKFSDLRPEIYLRDCRRIGLYCAFFRRPRVSLLHLTAVNFSYLLPELSSGARRKIRQAEHPIFSIPS